MAANIRFPVLATSGPVVFSYRSADELTEWGECDLGSDFARHLYLTDADLTTYPVLSVRKVCMIAPFGGWRLLESRRVRVSLELGTPEQLELEEMKQRVFQAFDADPDFWESGGDLDDQKQGIRAMTSFEEIVSRFLPGRK